MPKIINLTPEEKFHNVIARVEGGYASLEELLQREGRTMEEFLAGIRETLADLGIDSKACHTMIVAVAANYGKLKDGVPFLGDEKWYDILVAKNAGIATFQAFIAYRND